METLKSGFVVGVIIIVLVLLFKGCGDAISTPTQYETDYNSSRNKTWEELTPGEKKVVKDEIEWKLKQ